MASDWVAAPDEDDTVDEAAAEDEEEEEEEDEAPDILEEATPTMFFMTSNAIFLAVPVTEFTSTVARTAS